MPDVTTDDHVPRIVVDEASFDFRGINDDAVEAGLSEFADAVEDLREAGQAPAVCGLCLYVEARDGIELHQLLYGRQTTIDRDARLRVGRLLDKSPTWEEATQSGCEPIVLPETPIDCYSVGFAVAMALSGRTVGCLVVPTCPRRGVRTVGEDSSRAEVLFFAEAQDSRWVWRRVFGAERVPEHQFFGIATFAFPSLLLHPSLRFGRFQGRYADIRDRVVGILAALDDHLARVLIEHHGLPSAIAAAMGQYGVDLSPESSNTRASRTLMAQREVIYNGTTYTCEWHAKLERHRNRIHFTLPHEGPDGRILVGIFAEHLDV